MEVSHRRGPPLWCFQRFRVENIMLHDNRPQSSSHPGIAYSRIGLDPWTAEIAATDYAAANISHLVYRFFSLVFAGVDLLSDAIKGLRKSSPVEFEAVDVARPVHMPETGVTIDRAA